MKSSPEAVVIACFSVVVALLLGGWQQVTMLVARLFGAYLPGSSGGVEIVGTLAVAVVAGGAIVAARKVAPVVAGWPAHLAGATTILGALVAVASALSVLGTLVNNY